MAETQNNVRILHRKEWQTMQPVDTATAAGAFVVNDNCGCSRFSLYVLSATVHYLYDHEEDAWMPIASGVFSPALTAGACGTYSDWSPAFTATGGSTTTITVALNTHNINEYVVGKYVEFLSGTAANLGLRRLITNVYTTGVAGSSITITIAAAAGSVDNNDTFRINSGSFFVFTSGILFTSFKRFDIATMSWGSFLSKTNLAGTWGTDGRMVTTGMYEVSYDSGTASAGGATTLTDGTKSWAIDQWINYQVRITGGTGVGQIRPITDSTGTVLTVATWTTNPDNTSTYVIEGDENAIYLMGNNATTTVKYSISSDSWANISPTAARGGNAVAGMSADFVGKTGDATWALITNIQDGRYIYSFRGATSVLDRLSLNGGTSGAYTWETITYQPSLQTWATGASSDWDAGTSYIYVAKEGSATVPQRFYKYDVVGNTVTPVNSDWNIGGTSAGAAVIGNKIWIKKLSTTGTIKWVYCLQATSTNLRRLMLY